MSKIEKKLEKLRNDEGGFTLIELLVVMIIIGVLAAIAIPNYLQYQTNAKNKASERSLGDFRNAMENYYSQEGSVYPAPDDVNVSTTGGEPSAGIEWDTGMAKSYGFAPTDKVVVNLRKVSADSTGYCATAYHTDRKTLAYMYNSIAMTTPVTVDGKEVKLNQITQINKATAETGDPCQAFS